MTLKFDLWPWKWIGFFICPYKVHTLSLSILGQILLAISCPHRSKCQNSLKRPSDLEMWPLTLKIYRLLPLPIWSIHTKFVHRRPNSSCYILPTRIMDNATYIRTCTYVRTAPYHNTSVIWRTYKKWEGLWFPFVCFQENMSQLILKLFLGTEQSTMINIIHNVKSFFYFLQRFMVI